MGDDASVFCQKKRLDTRIRTDILNNFYQTVYRNIRQKYRLFSPDRQWLCYTYNHLSGRKLCIWFCIDQTVFRNCLFPPVSGCGIQIQLGMIRRKHATIIAKTAIIHQRVFIFVQIHFQIIHDRIGIISVHDCECIFHGVYRISFLLQPSIDHSRIPVRFLCQQIFCIPHHSASRCHNIRQYGQ